MNRFWRNFPKLQRTHRNPIQINQEESYKAKVQRFTKNTERKCYFGYKEEI